MQCNQCIRFSVCFFSLSLLINGIAHEKHRERMTTKRICVNRDTQMEWQKNGENQRNGTDNTRDARMK